MVTISGGNELLDAAAIFKRVGLNAGMKVADLGCGGAGHFIIPAARLVGGKEAAYAVDILKSVLHAVSSKARIEGVNNIKTVWSNLEAPGATNIPAASLDVALLINILFQSKQHEAVINEAARLLKGAGKLLIIDWNKTASPLGPSVTDRVDPATLKKISEKLNLKLIEEFDAGTYHFGLIFQK